MNHSDRLNADPLSLRANRGSEGDDRNRTGVGVRSSRMADASVAYQQQLEILRAYDGDDDRTLAELEEDLEKARAVLWTAWIEHGMGLAA